MIFAFLDDQTLEIVEDVKEANSNYEGIDVEEGAYRFFNESGIYLEPKFTVPNRRGKVLWLLPWSVSGTYDLIPNFNYKKCTIAQALKETPFLQRNKYFKDMNELKESLRSRGVKVDEV